jgi:hypothetical protein
MIGALVLVVFARWYGVEAVSTPRVAPQDAFGSQPGTFQDPVALDGLNRIVGTSRPVSAPGSGAEQGLFQG